jgi:repressor LexA
MRERVGAHVEAPSRSTVLPLVGDVAAGTGLVADEQVEDMVAVPEQLCADADFLLTINGDSMVNAGILQGDLVLVRPQAEAPNGTIVVAMVEGDATVKRLQRMPTEVRLIAENPDYQPIVSRDVTLVGVVKGVLRIF